MKASLLTLPNATARTRLADYLELTKPRVAVMVLATVAAGAALASRGRLDLLAVLHAVCGTALVAAGASALNQVLERHSDALMPRTENRPLPAGRLLPLEAMLFGAMLAIAGLTYLLVVGQTLAALIAALTFASYVFLYTPLKRITTLNTLVGAVPGALPPVIGWTAVRGSVDAGAVALFLILFFWQVPHFLAIAWIYRQEYARARLRMLPVLDPDGDTTCRQMVSYSLALIPASLAPAVLGFGGIAYLAGAVLLGLSFLACALAFRRSKSTERARGVLRASLVYLPALLGLLLITGRWAG